MNKLLVRSVAIACLAWSTLAFSEPAALRDRDRPVPDKGKVVVLVHGAYVDGSSWRKVTSILQERGLRVIAVQNPLTSLAADVDATNRAINQAGGEVILVGHSWGGAVITQAGNNAHVSSLVYVAAFALETGQSVNLLVQNLPPPPNTPELRLDEGNYLTFSPKGMAKYFAPDLPTHEVELLTASQVPWFSGELDDKITYAAWHVKPSWWVLSEEDQIIPPMLQQAMAAQINAVVTPVRSGHTVMLSHPEKVAHVILQAAGME